MEIHYTKHHQAYVDNLNKALAGHADLQGWSVRDLIKRLDEVPETIRPAVRNHGGGHLNHSWFWQWMAPQSGGKPNGKLATAIASTFGSFESFQEGFMQAGIARFGSGWAWLIVNNGKLEIRSTPNQDNPLIDGIAPILGCDIWEHAYYLKYQNRRGEYLKAWWNVVNWEYVAALYGAVAG